MAFMCCVSRSKEPTICCTTFLAGELAAAEKRLVMDEPTDDSIEVKEAVVNETGQAESH